MYAYNQYVCICVYVCVYVCMYVCVCFSKLLKLILFI